MNPCWSEDSNVKHSQSQKGMSTQTKNILKQKSSYFELQRHTAETALRFQYRICYQSLGFHSTLTHVKVVQSDWTPSMLLYQYIQ